MALVIKANDPVNNNLERLDALIKTGHLSATEREAARGIYTAFAKEYIELDHASEAYTDELDWKDHEHYMAELATRIAKESARLARHPYLRRHEDT